MCKWILRLFLKQNIYYCMWRKDFRITHCGVKIYQLIVLLRHSSCLFVYCINYWEGKQKERFLSNSPNNFFDAAGISFSL